MATSWWRAPTALALLLLCAGGECAVPRPAAASEEDGGAGGQHAASRAEGSRPSRGSAMLDETEEEAEPREAGAAVPGDAGGASAEWQSATEGIASDMRAHLKRRQKKAEADLIVRSRGPVTAVLFGLGDFLRSKYFANVRKSIGVFAGMWLWYVLNTKTYMPPEIEE